MGMDANESESDGNRLETVGRMQMDWRQSFLGINRFEDVNWFETCMKKAIQQEVG